MSTVYVCVVYKCVSLVVGDLEWVFTHIQQSLHMDCCLFCLFIASFWETLHSPRMQHKPNTSQFLHQIQPLGVTVILPLFFSTPSLIPLLSAVTGSTHGFEHMWKHGRYYSILFFLFLYEVKEYTCDREEPALFTSLWICTHTSPVVQDSGMLFFLPKT